MGAKHCSDADLLAWSDGELPLLRGWRVHRHVQLCWACRSRAEAIRNDVACVGRKFAEGRTLSPLLMDRGRERLRAALLTGSRAEPQRQTTQSWLVWTAVGAILVLWIAGWWSVRPGAAPALAPHAASFLAQVMAAESSTASAPVAVEQEFRVEFVRTGERGATVARQLTVVSAVRQGRTRAVWAEVSGRPRIAVWRPGDGRTWRSEHGGEPRMVQAAFDSDPVSRILDTRELEELEQAFVEWIASRRWEPLHLGSGFAAFAAGDGSRMLLEKGPAYTRLVAVRERNGRRITVTMDVDGNLAVQRMSVRTQWSDGATEIRLVPARAAAWRQVRPEMFEPPRARRVTAAATASATSFAGPALTAAELVRVQSAIHELALCAGDDVSVRTDDFGRVILTTNSTLLTRFRDDPAVIFEAPKDVERVHPSAVIVHRVLDDAAAGKTVFELRTSLPDARERAHRLLRASEAALRDAWALQKHAEGFTQELLDALPKPDRERLSRIASEHLDSVETSLGGVRLLVEPLELDDPPATVSPHPMEWLSVLRQVYDSVKDVRACVLSIASIGGEPAATDCTAELLPRVSRAETASKKARR